MENSRVTGWLAIGCAQRAQMRWRLIACRAPLTKLSGTPFGVRSTRDLVTGSRPLNNPGDIRLPSFNPLGCAKRLPKTKRINRAAVVAINTQLLAGFGLRCP